MNLFTFIFHTSEGTAVLMGSSWVLGFITHAVLTSKQRTIRSE
jgi:hypothetical protein